MTRFSKKVARTARTRTTNKAGGEAFKENPKLEFVSTVLTTFLTDQYYRSGDQTIGRIVELIEKLDPKFVAKTAIFARTKFGMRSVSHLIAGELAHVKNETWTKNFFEKVIYRPDDITEILAYYFNNTDKDNPRTLPDALRKGLAKAFDKFDGYSLAKYRGEGNDISLVDSVNLLHPKPVEANPEMNIKGNAEALAKLMKGELKSVDTWETKLTQAGQKAKDEEEKLELKKDAWVDLIKNKKIKYFALLRNLRNIIEQAPEVLDEACAMLEDEKLISKSLVLPFRYMSALREIEQLNGKEARKVIASLNKAVDISVKNVPSFPGDTLVALDCSGSMGGRPIEIGSLFAAILAKASNADLILFSDDAKYLSLNIADSTLSLVDKITKSCAMAGTNFPPIFRTANKKYDRVFILSDMQGWMEGGQPGSTFSAYKKKYTAEPYVYSFNLNDYGTIMFPEKRVFCLAGWSEKVFDIVKLLEEDKDAMINEIEKIQLEGAVA